MKPTNGTGLTLIDSTPDSDPPPSDPLTNLQAQVTDLRSEMHLGFSGIHSAIDSLRGKDVEHDAKLDQLARRVTIPLAALTVLLEIVRAIAQHWQH